ncbi:hypothetical protein M408DRAFT_15821 [Serendipita vermifera MAFF 305830]|uniref:Uncharacterized protein n=1 Tax=Serendipita vermifera MAFF 305830 TaxID=933852 RepID=A0A0C2WTF3_SERVB|nr:hypothetical protein M408DRAFT_15821 [Serendipita vermifera MAFF 305830]
MSATRAAQNPGPSNPSASTSSPTSSPIRNAVSSSPERSHEPDNDNDVDSDAGATSSPVARPATPTPSGASGSVPSTHLQRGNGLVIAGTQEDAHSSGADRPGTPVDASGPLEGTAADVNGSPNGELGANGHSDGSTGANGSSSPMELVDEDMAAGLDHEVGDEYIQDDFMQDLRRVKVYELVGQNWNDLGTAFCSGEYDEQIREAQLIAKSEETQEVLLQITVRADDVYQRQADTLIVWTELNGKDYALSFQDVEGCTEVWEFILEVRRHLRSSQEQPPPLINPTLPEPTLANLLEIEKQIRAVHRAGPIRVRVAENVVASDLVRKLVVLMRDAEDLQSIEDLHAVCLIMQAILLLNDQSIYDYVLRDDIFMDMIGLMEYDPEFPRLKANYRDFLAENAKHHQVVEFRDPAIRAKVHHTYRLQYLKDVVLARALDDVIFNSISSTIIFNQIEIVTYIQNEEYFLREVFSIFVQHPSGAPPATPTSHGLIDGQVEKIQVYTEDRRAPALLLLHQFCTMGKNGQVPFRLALFRSLVDRGVLYPVQWALGQSDARVLNTAAEILAMVLDHDAGGVRGHILRQVEEDARREGGETSGNGDVTDGATSGMNGDGPSAPSLATGSTNPPTLLAMMTSILTNTQHELSLKSQLADSFRTLMDVPGLDATVPGMKLIQPMIRKEEQQSDRFLDYFYKKCAISLYAPLLENVPEHKNVTSFPLVLSRAHSDLYLYLCDLLCGFMLQHSYQSHFFVLGNNIASRIASLLYAREKHLRLAALRFFRTCLRLSNRNLLANLTKNDVFSPILELTRREAARDNLLSSCCQEFFENLRRENFKEVIDHVMKIHEPLVRQLAKSPIVGDRFTELIRKWEQNNEPPPKPEPKPIPVQRRWGAARVVDTEDEYFNADEEEPAVVAGRQTRGQSRRRGTTPQPNAGTGPSRRTQRPINVALPRVYPISGALVDYQEEEETPDGASPPSPDPVKVQPEPKVQDGSRLRGRARRPDLTRTASSPNLDPSRTNAESSSTAAPGAPASMEAETTTAQPEPSRSKKRQLRVKLGETPLAAQPPDVKVGDKG